MTPNFASAIDPIFLHILSLLERISSGQTASASEERATILNLLREAEARLGQKSDWELAKYALTAWIDDMLIEAPWDGRIWWKENALEVELFNTRDRATTFFVKGKEAASLTRRDAFEVFYVCVVLGFRGLYRDSQAAAFLADQLGLPPDLESWAKQATKSIQLGQGRPPVSEAPRPGEGAPPLEGKFLLLGTALAGVILLTANVILFALIWYVWTPES